MEHRPEDLTIGKNRREHSTKEQEPLLKLDETLGEIDMAIKDLDGTSLTSEQQLRLRKIKKNVIRSTKKFLRVARKIAAVGALIGLVNLSSGINDVNYSAIYSHVQETTNQNGEVIYTHPDERTTHYLNILAGRDRFTEEDLNYANENDRTTEDLNMLVVRDRLTEDDLEFANRNNMTTKDLDILVGLGKFTEEDLERMQRDFLKSQLKMLKIEISPPVNIEKMSSLELLTIMSEDPRVTSRPLPHEEAEIRAQKQATENNRLLTKEIKERVELSKDIYSLVWQLEKEGGNPRIRFIAKDTGFNLTPRSKRAEHYDSSSNTIYIELESLISGSGVVAEMSHGKQFKNDPLGSYFLGFRDVINVFLKSWFSTERREEEYEKLYTKLGTLEYQAHNVIEPDLEKRYPFMPYLKERSQQE